MKQFLFIVCIGLVNGLFAQDNDYVIETLYLNEDIVYDSLIQTVMVYPFGNELADPILKLGNPESVLDFHFDDLHEEKRSFRYKIQHCNADWKVSSLLEQEFLQGFSDGVIQNETPSFNTDIPYTHFQFQLPNNEANLLVSGNYLVTVYDMDDPEERPKFSRRFFVEDTKVTLTGNVHNATLVNEMYYKQEVDFEIETTNYPITDPYERLKVVVVQNNQWNHAKSGIIPRYVAGDKLIYNYDKEINFWGYNEFRSVNIKSMTFVTPNVLRMRYNKSLGANEVSLIPQEQRSFKNYYSERDINGNFFIRREGAQDYHADAEYVMVHFNLYRDEPITDGPLYIYGKLSDWRYYPRFKMKYNAEVKRYEAAVWLKQGYYNYAFCVAKDAGNDKPDMSIVEGSYSKTENDYVVYVYYRSIDQDFDQLIAVHKFNSLGN